jgi:hypothetical protein
VQMKHNRNCYLAKNIKTLTRKLVTKNIEIRMNMKLRTV